MRRLSFLFRCLLSLGLIVFIIRKIEWAALGAVLARLELSWALLATSLASVVIIGLAVRWNLFLRQQGMQLPFGTVLSLTWAGQFFNSVLPGSTGGDVFKILQICRRNPTRKTNAAATVLADRLSALAALLVLAGIGVLVEPGPLQLLANGRLTRENMLKGLACCFFLTGVLWIVVRLFRSAKWFAHVTRVLAAVRGTFAASREMYAASLLSFAIHIVNFVGIYFFARSLGLEISCLQVILMMPVVLLIILLPITINGHGIRELLLIGYFTQMGVRLRFQNDIGFKEEAVALSVLIVTSDLLWSLPGGLQYFLRFRRAEDPSLLEVE